MKNNARGRLSPEILSEGILNRDRIKLAKAITLTESKLASDRALADEVIERVMPFTGNSYRVGLTGVPGVGKSTFTETFGKVILEHGHRLAVLAIDPSSQVSGGSILGDKTRMEELSMHKDVFIRPSPSGDSLGGVSRKTRETILLCEAAGFDFIIVETVGVGQSETLISEMTDFFLLLMLAGAGDELQGIKRGIMEMADAVVITKADGDNIQNAKNAKRNYANALHLFPPKPSAWTAETHISSAMTKAGMNEIYDMLRRHRDLTRANGWFERNRAEQNLLWLRQTVLRRLEEDFFGNKTVAQIFEQMKDKVRDGQLPPSVAAERLLEAFFADARHNDG